MTPISEKRGIEPIMRHVPRCVGVLRPDCVVLDLAVQTEENEVASRGQNFNGTTAELNFRVLSTSQARC